MLDTLLYHRASCCRGGTNPDSGSDHVFALCDLLGFHFAPHIPDLKH